MQITFDTTNPSDLKILSALLNAVIPNEPAAAAVVEPQPEPEVDPRQIELPGMDPEPAPQPAAEKPKRTRKVKEEVAPEPAPQPEPMELPREAVEAMDETIPEPAKPLTLDEVRGALQQFTAAKGVPAGIELLKQYNAGRISELAATDYAKFVAECAA